MILSEFRKSQQFVGSGMRLCHPPDGSTSPKYKLLCFITTKKFAKRRNALAFNQDRCCHLVLCLRLIPFHCNLAHAWRVFVSHAMEQRTFKNVINYLNTNIYSYLETSGGQSSNLYLNVVHFSNTRVN
jgi:hypothetical protein